MGHSNAQALREVAEAHLAATVKRLPVDRLDRFALFVEVVRVMDYWAIHAPSISCDSEMALQSFDLMYWGWNRAVAELFESLDQPGAFPLMESTQASREFAIVLLQEFGKVSLLRRFADMGERKMIEIARDGDEFQIRMSADAGAQLADAVEWHRLKTAEAGFSSATSGWSLVSMRDALHFPDMQGNYIAFAGAPVKRWLRPDIQDLIKPLVKPWDTGRGIMVSYDARLEVDKHYMAEALALAAPWLDDSGIHAKAKLGSISGADIGSVGAALISLHVKHFGCVAVAKKLFDQVSVAQSLTIWGPRADLEESISLMSGSSKVVVNAVFNTLAMSSEHAKRLADHSTPLIPLLFDLGNGFILRPVSSLTRNPFTAARIQHQWLDQRTEHAVAAHREDWMRAQLYGLFGGKRYIRFPGNLKLRRAGAVLTDVDAIIYDRATGDVGLFQLKWQDYSTNDVRQLQSKASNLSAELIDWSSKVKLWIEENGVSALNQSLRLKQKRREAVRSVLLFAISRSSVRTKGYGFKTETPDLAMATWPQFVRTRMEVGPSKRSLRDMHTQLLKELEYVPNNRPMPATLKVTGATLHVHDFWNRTDSGDGADL